VVFFGTLGVVSSKRLPERIAMKPIAFTCACCGQKVTALPDLAYDAPQHYSGLSEAERAARASLDADFCVIDGEDRFIRAVCLVPIVDTDEHFAWGVWVSLSAENFQRYADSFQDDDQSKLGQMFGWFCNRLPNYPETLSLQATVVPQDNRQRPLVWINDAHADHPLYIEQRRGITPERLGEIYAREVCENYKQNTE
jgi:hypothetical protein